MSKVNGIMEHKFELKWQDGSEIRIDRKVFKVPLLLRLRYWLKNLVRRRKLSGSITWEMEIKDYE